MSAGGHTSARAEKRSDIQRAFLSVDTISPSGDLMARVLATFAAYERQLISQRAQETRSRVKRAQGVRLGLPRPPVREDTAADTERQ
jgi:DNA invertase Pin-like site-specific DNA recombinase